MCDNIGVLDRIITPSNNTKVNIVGEKEFSKLKFVKLMGTLITNRSINKNVQDMTIKSFFDMNFGENSYELTKMIDPMMSGIFAGDVNELSVKATMGGFLSFLKDS